MIIDLTEAQGIDPDITQDDLDAFETAVRRLTNNNFHNKHARFKNINFVNESTVEVDEDINGLREGDTVEVNYSHFNDGLYVISQINERQIQVDGEPFFGEETPDVMLTKVEYPADIKQGVKKLIAYDVKMGDKMGIKSQTISRMHTVYYDVTAAENTDGYPASLLSFLNKYEKMRW